MKRSPSSGDGHDGGSQAARPKRKRPYRSTGGVFDSSATQRKITWTGMANRPKGRRK